MSGQPKTKRKKARLAEESVEFEDLAQLKFRKRPFLPYRIRGVIVPSNWLVLDKCRYFYKVFSTSRIEEFRQKVEREFANMMKESYRVCDSCNLHQKPGAKRTIGLSQVETYLLVEKAIRKATKYALQNQPPPIMTPSLRAVSANVLELLASLYKIDIPSRRSTDKHSQFLIYIADWSAKIFCHIHRKICPCDDDADYCTHSPSSKLSVACSLDERTPLTELFSSITPSSQTNSSGTFSYPTRSAGPSNDEYT